MELVFVVAVVSLLLIAVPVIAPHVGLLGGVVCFGLAARYLLKAHAAAAPLPAGAAPPRFNWGLDLPIGIAVALYGALWIGIAVVSLRAERALELEPGASLA